MTTDKTPKKALRQDAQRRRERLVRAAVELYAEEGIDVPLEKIADRAAVGRATLYRNFPDREALTAAVREKYLDDLRAEVERWGERDDAFFLGIRALARLTIASGGFRKIMPLERQAPWINKGFRSGVEKLLTKPLAQAKASGLVRADFDISDVHLAALMVAGGGLDSRGNPELRIDAALQLLTRGLARSPR